MEKDVALPKSWNLSGYQECVIGSLLDAAPDYVPFSSLTKAMYGKASKTAPAKLRVTVQRCRDIVWDKTEGNVEIEGKRGSGWRLTVRGALVLKKYVEKANETAK
jgi:hypothetical protein